MPTGSVTTKCSAAEPQTDRPALLVFSDDWGRHPSSCQHLVRRMLPRYRVAWVNTIGMRRPAFDWITLSRGLGKVRTWLRPTRQDRDLQANPRVLSPRMWPWFGRRHDRWLNRRLLLRQLGPAVAAMGSHVVAITTLPIVADLMDRLPVDRWVYYCVDDFSKWPGMDPRAIVEMEERVAQRADVLIAVSELLQQRLGRAGKPVHLLTHGVDLEHWSTVRPGPAPQQLAGLERPLVLFWGSIDWQMDLGFLRRLASDLERGTIVLVGPRTDHDPALFRIPRVVWVPKVPYEELPAIAREAAVLVMPYIDAPGLRESQPLKLKEYLASGKPAEVRDLPANRVWADALDLAGTPEEFSAAVRRRLIEGLSPQQRAARQRLERETWDQKAQQFERWAMGEDG